MLYALGVMHKSSGQCHCNKLPSSCSFFAGALSFPPVHQERHPHSGAFSQHLFTIFLLFLVVAHLGELVSLFSGDLRHFFQQTVTRGTRKTIRHRIIWNVMLPICSK